MRNSIIAFCTKSDTHEICIIILFAVLVRLFTLTPVGFDENVDAIRFSEQAQSIIEGKGYTWHGRYETERPPGYPVLLSYVMRVSANERFLQFIGMLCSVLTCVFVYSAARNITPHGALVIGLLMAVNPWYAWMSTWIMSETFGAFIAGVFVYLLSKFIASVPKIWHCFATGVVSVFLVLVSPGAAFLSFFAWCWVLIRTRKKLPQVFSLVIGASVVMSLWQVHCVFATGDVVPRLLTPIYYTSTSPFAKWVRTWSPSNNEGGKAFQMISGDIEFFDSNVPNYAFASMEQRLKLRDRLIAVKAGEVAWKTVEQDFGNLADELRGVNPIFYNFYLPLRRALSLWIPMPMASHIQPIYVMRFGAESMREDMGKRGFLFAFAKILKAIVSTVGFVVYYLYFAFWCSAAIGALVDKRRASIVVLIIAGVLLYTFVCATMAIGEQRRNVVFYPFFFYIAALGWDELFSLLRKHYFIQWLSHFFRETVLRHHG